MWLVAEVVDGRREMGARRIKCRWGAPECVSIVVADVVRTTTLLNY